LESSIRETHLISPPSFLSAPPTSALLPMKVDPAVKDEPNGVPLARRTSSKPLTPVPKAGKKEKSPTTPTPASRPPSTLSQGPQFIGHLPRVNEDALKTFINLEANIYQFKYLGLSKSIEEGYQCDCVYEHGGSRASTIHLLPEISWKWEIYDRVPDAAKDSLTIPVQVSHTQMMLAVKDLNVSTGSHRSNVMKPNVVVEHTVKTGGEDVGLNYFLDLYALCSIVSSGGRPPKLRSFRRRKKVLVFELQRTSPSKKILLLRHI
jgi:hypothetical protein